MLVEPRRPSQLEIAHMEAEAAAVAERKSMIQHMDRFRTSVTQYRPLLSRQVEALASDHPQREVQEQILESIADLDSWVMKRMGYASREQFVGKLSGTCASIPWGEAADRLGRVGGVIEEVSRASMKRFLSISSVSILVLTWCDDASILFLHQSHYVKRTFTLFINLSPKLFFFSDELATWESSIRNMTQSLVRPALTNSTALWLSSSIYSNRSCFDFNLITRIPLSKSCRILFSTSDLQSAAVRGVPLLPCQ